MNRFLCVALLAICGAAAPAFSQQTQRAASPESAPKAATTPAPSPQSTGVVPGSLSAASRAASQALQEMTKERMNPPPVDMPDAPITNKPKKP